MPFHDLRIAVRNLVRRPAFAITAVLLLAVGAGANAAVFSVVRGVLVRPLPYPEPDRLVAFWPGAFISNEEVDYWRQHTHSVAEIATQAPGWMMALTSTGQEPLKVTGAKTSDNLFTTLGVRAAVGRVIEPGDAAPGRPRVAVIADNLWRTRFAASTAVIGSTIHLDQEPHVVVGVMPRGFEVFEPGTDVWVALPWEPTGPSFRTTFSVGVARLRSGISIEAATGELQSLAPAARRDLKRDNDWGRTVHVASLQETITGNIRPTLLILLGAVGLILLLAAVNLGTLALGRSIERLRESAVRAALGASRARLARQIVLEQAVVAVAGAVAGILAAWALLPILVRHIPPEVPRAGDIALDWTVLGTVLVVSVVLAIALAVTPAMLAARPSLQPLLRQSRVTDTPARRRLLGALVGGQIALAVVLGIGALLMLRSLWNLQHVDPGFRPENVLTLRLQTTSKYRALSTGVPYLEQVVERVRGLPGVANVGAIAHLPLSGYAWTIPMRRADQPLAPGEAPPRVGWRFIGWDYFQAMGISLRHGRRFTSTDTSAGRPVAIVNETLARRFFDDAEAALGRTVVVSGGGRPGEETVDIVGIAGDVRHLSLDQPPVPEMFRPLAQTFMFPMALVVRTAGPPVRLSAAVRQAALEIDPAIPVAEMQPYTTLVADTLGRPRLLSFLLSVFAASGLLLGLVGVYGVTAYRVRQHEREIGIRLALGAAPSRMAGRVVRQGLVQAVLGLAVGLPAAFFLARAMRSVIFGVSTTDPITFATLPALVIVVSMAACYLPARRASRIDPLSAIKDEA